MPLLFVVFVPALAALFLIFYPRRVISQASVVVTAALFLVLLTLQPGSSLSVSVPWVPSLGLELGFYLDGLNWVFALIVTGIGALVLLYSTGYFESESDLVRFTAYTLLFMTAMLGLVLSKNLLLMFGFWELTSVTSYLLIGFNHENEAAREGARRALLVTGGGGLALLGGVAMVGIMGGTFDLPTLLANGDVLRSHALYAPAVVLILIGAFSKSAQYPLHFWLPGAMEAPTPASAYLHSATMVKAGVFLLARLSPALAQTDLWFLTLLTFGLFTFVYGALVALRQTDLKAILAYSTVSWLGVLVAVQAAGTTDGAKALIVGVLAHALYKGALFLIVGSVDHATGTRQIDKLGRLARSMPYTAGAAVIAGLSMAGIPPLLGFMAKETLKAAALDSTFVSPLTLIFPAAAVIGSALTVAVAARVVWEPFFGAQDAQGHPHEAPLSMWIGPAMMGVLSILGGVLISVLAQPLVAPAVSAVTGTNTEVELELFHGFNLPLLLTLGSQVLGLVIFFVRKPLIAALKSIPEFNPTAVYNWLFLRAVPDGSVWLARRVQSGNLRYYIIVIMVSFVVTTMGAVAVSGLDIIGEKALTGFTWPEAFLCLLIMLSGLATLYAPTRLSAIAAMGVDGALVALLFAIFGAPDLAFTQFMIEVISLVLFVLAFQFLPDIFPVRFRRISKLRDVIVSVGVGVAVMILVLVTNANPVAPSIVPWYIEHSEEIGKGTNVVNVIVVDFRGLDTQGEIVVLVIAAMGVTALRRLRPRGQPRGRRLHEDDELYLEHGHSPNRNPALPDA